MSQAPMQNGTFLAQQMLQHDRLWVPEMVQIPRKMMQRGAFLSRSLAAPFPMQDPPELPLLQRLLGVPCSVVLAANM